MILHGGIVMRHFVKSGLILIIILLFSLSVKTDVDPDLLLYLDFNEGQGDTLKDLSGNGHDAVIHGKSPVWEAGKFGPAIYFNGEDNYGEIQRTDALTFGEDTEFTVMAWIKTEFEPPENIGILTNYKEQTTPFWNICIRREPVGIIRFQFRDVDGNIVRATSPDPINDGQWHHIAGVRDLDADTARLYVDGKLMEEVKDTSSFWPGPYLT
ncbi:hypothetical protein GF312_00100 [Candidatus Poribacteria bacterium]|nr:hypothetical protein [Candidatus Poribacteria bacterium]